MIFIVSSNEPPSTTICSISGYDCDATLANVSAMVADEFRQTVMMEIFLMWLIVK